ncbi:uncharacterized protein LOC107272570 isoform X2 [Cephus cinctus]|uniref:Uncharacterized protein LOC107272570 isoform X2 n=1 Tax=Cephus cinctus TaxID=211228 RepID=A0AAJ7C9L2_CEPCN|nr:uncharacterized protein LOC107272570 isoform X2 [Cephus cinctus]
MFPLLPPSAIAFLLLVFWIEYSRICGSLDVTTIYRGRSEFPFNYTSVECHSRTDALGLPFIAPNGTTFEPEVGLVVPSCQIGLRPNCPWTSQGWEITGGIDLNLPPLRLQYETVHVHTNGVLMSQLTPLFWPRFNFTLRTSTRGMARVFLMNEADVNTADMYVIDIIHNMLYLAHQTSSILKCGRGRLYTHEVDLGLGIGIRRCHSIGNVYIRWLAEENVMFKMDVSGGKIQLFRNVSSTLLFSQVDSNPLRVKYIAVSTSEIERDWTLLLDNRVWSLVGVSGILKSPILASSDAPSICVSFFAYLDSTPGSRIKVSVHLSNGSVKTMGQIISATWENKQWLLQRLVLDLSDENVNQDLQILIEGLKGNPFAVVSIHGLMGCNPDDNEEIAVIQVHLDRNQPFVCNVPTYGEQKRLSKSCRSCFHGGQCDALTGQCTCPPGFIGETCEEGCGENAFGRDCLGQCSGRKDGCTGLVLCAPIVGCNCATGYTGTGCDLECAPGWYGPNCAFACGSCDEFYCDIFTGVCPEGCTSGHYPPLCNLTYTYLLQPPTISDIGATRVTFTFEAGDSNMAGSGKPRFYQVQLKEVKSTIWKSRIPVLLPEHPVHRISGVAEDLRPGVNYLLRIILIDRDGNFFSNDTLVPYAMVTTTCQVPVNPVYDVKATWKKRYEFEVEWEYDPNDYTACELIHYRVYLREGWRRYLYNITTENSITVPDRSPFFKYSVQVQAVTSRGSSIVSEPAVVRTVQGAPSRVTRLTTRQISPTELQVEWREPRVTTGKIKNYIVEYECLRYLACPELTCQDSKNKLQTSHLNLNLSGLYPHAQYSIKVAAVIVEMGPWSRIIAATSFAAPEAAPAPAEHPILSRTASTIEVTWNPVADCKLLHGFPLYYHYWLFMKEQPDDAILVAEGNVTHPPVNFTSLRPYTNYVVQVEQVVTDGLYNSNYKLEIPVRTRGTVSPIVRDLQAVDITSSTVTLIWSYPKGVSFDAVKHFIVVFMCVRLLACRDFFYNCSNNGTIEINDTRVLLSDLTPYAKYEIKVAAFTGEVGNFASLSIKTLTSPPQVGPRPDPERPPQSGSTWLAVWWLPPLECAKQHGPIIGYRHNIFRDDDESLTWSDESLTSTTFTKDTWANFTGLTSFTGFKVVVAIVNNQTDITPWQEIRAFNFSVWTRPEVPDAVKELIAYKHGNTLIGLRWRPTRYLHGPIDFVNIRITAAGQQVINQRAKVMNCLAWINHMCYEITGLKANTAYNISVRPFSSVVGEEGLPANVTVKTEEGIPDPPSFIRLVRKTDRSFVIEWGHPNMSNGILRSFRILTDHVDSYNSEMCCDTSMSADVQVLRENATYAAHIKGLKPASEYFITLVAVTYVPSEPISMTIYTRPGVPELQETPPHIIMDTITNVTAEVVLTPASDFNGGPIWVYFVMVCGSGAYDHHDDDSDPILTEVKDAVNRKGFVAMTLNDEELDDTLIITIGNGEESLGLYGFIRNQPLRPNTTYTIVQVVMSEYMDSRSFGMVESEPFVTKP